MKKLFSTLLLVFFFTSFQAFADGEFTTRQLALRSEIQSFLKQEGFMPEIDSDGDIKFKREGNTYYVRIDKANKSPMYLRLQSYYNYSDNLSKSKISAALPDLNLWKAVKVVMYESQSPFRPTCSSPVPRPSRPCSISSSASFPTWKTKC